MQFDHKCAGMTQLGMEPWFAVDEGVNILTGQTMTVVWLVLPAGHMGAIKTQVDFCPWCGKGLSTDTLASMASVEKMEADRMLAYKEYRRRWVKQGTAGAPLDLEGFNIAANEWQEIEFLLPHAADEHKDGLFRRKQQLRDKLALGVVLEAGTPVPDHELEGLEPMM